jgi:hypothetical protein
MEPKRKTSITEEQFQRATDDIIEKVLDETCKELLPRLRKKENTEKTSKNILTAVTGQ